MNMPKSVTVVELPTEMTAPHSEMFFHDMLPILRRRQPRVVFDCSRASKIDRDGMDVLLRCLAHAMQFNGDIKLSSVGSAVDAMLNVTRGKGLFEIFSCTADAVESFGATITPGDPVNTYTECLTSLVAISSL